MAKFIILFFITIGAGVSYLTYTGTGQEKLETLEKESVRSNSYRVVVALHITTLVVMGMENKLNKKETTWKHFTLTESSLHSFTQGLESLSFF